VNARLIGTIGVAALAVVAACRSKPPAPNIPGLIADLTNPDPEVSGRANLTLIRLGEPAVPPLVELLQSDDVRLRTLAATTLFGLGEKGRAAVPALVATLGDAEASVRLTAAMALGNMGAEAKEAVPALIRSLKDRDGKVSQWAANALGSIGPAAEAAVPALVQAARAEGIRHAAEDAIRRIRGLSPDQPLPAE